MFDGVGGNFVRNAINAFSRLYPDYEDGTTNGAKVQLIFDEAFALWGTDTAIRITQCAVKNEAARTALTCVEIAVGGGLMINAYRRYCNEIGIRQNPPKSTWTVN